ncbi:MAG TPA: VWA domain-containing protein [Pyrinomonadaceae bacterium]|nr:VWA domain-containing protein [Pyrinomonadaceae bacterium]
MRFLSIMFSCCLLACTSTIRVTAQARTDQDDDVIRTVTDLTNLLFTATDKNRRFVTTLRQEDIRVLEDGVPQTLFTFQRETDRPLAVALLIDVSLSEERTLSQEKAAARSFVETIIRSSKDQAAVIPFTASAFLEQGLTRDVLSIYRALERVEVAAPSYTGAGHPISGLPVGPGRAFPREGMTAIWDAITLSANRILAPSTGQRRRAIILLTDGWDTSSSVTMSTAINQAIESETIIYAIGIGDKRYEGVDESGLHAIAERTGGRAFFPKKNVDLTAAFEAIEQELRSQYLLAFSSTNKQRDGKFRQLQIVISNHDLLKEQLKLRYRPGYVAKPYSGQAAP